MGKALTRAILNAFFCFPVSVCIVGMLFCISDIDGLLLFSSVLSSLKGIFCEGWYFSK